MRCRSRRRSAYLRGMAIVTAANWTVFSGLTLTTAQTASVESICTKVDAAIERKCRPWLFEPRTLSSIILDAPLEDVLVLPVMPIRSITSLYLNWMANGDPSAFTSDHLLTNYTDYFLEIDDPINGWSRSGIVRSRARGWYGGGVWGGERRYPPERLTGALTPGRGAIKITFTAGMTDAPDDVKLAANLAVSLIYSRRVNGAAVQSESWNGESYSLAGPYTAESALNTPDIASLLSGYCVPTVGRA